MLKLQVYKVPVGRMNDIEVDVGDGEIDRKATVLQGRGYLIDAECLVNGDWSFTVTEPIEEEILFNIK